MTNLHSLEHILLIFHIAFFAFFAYCNILWHKNCAYSVQDHSFGGVSFISILPGSPSYGPTVHIAPPTSGSPLFYYKTRLERPGLSSKGIVSVAPTGTRGSRPCPVWRTLEWQSAQDLTRLSLDSRHSYMMVDWDASNQAVQQSNRIRQNK